MVVACNKMDDKTVGYAQARFDEICKEVGSYLKKVGYNPEKVSSQLRWRWGGGKIQQQPSSSGQRSLLPLAVYQLTKGPKTKSNSTICNQTWCGPRKDRKDHKAASSKTCSTRIWGFGLLRQAQQVQQARVAAVLQPPAQGGGVVHSSPHLAVQSCGG